MNMPFALPDWVPWWVTLAVLAPILVYLAGFLLMPFSVFGVKGRLDLIDARLDEIQGEIRTLSLRLPDAAGAAPHPRGTAEQPPIPPAPPPADRPRRPMSHGTDADWDQERDEDVPRRLRGPGGRSEPRLGWPPG